jgi:hypothetical protein
MFSRTLFPVVAVLACLAVGGAPALATDDPPQNPPQGQSPPGQAPGSGAPGTAPGTTPGSPGAPSAGGCADRTRPRTRVVTTSRLAVKKHLLRGTASDKGCAGSNVALVSVSIARKQGSHCQYLSKKAKLSRATTCKRPRWMSATGTKAWRVRLPRRLPRGSYQVLTRAVDSAGNVERAHARRLAIR